MRPLKRIAVLALVGLSWQAGSSRLLAEDTKGKWQFGFGLSYFSTVDYIRSNADLAIASGIVDQNGLPSVGSVDERPDINIMNQASIRDDFKLDFSASYGLTRWLAVEAAASYMKSPVGNIEFYTRNVTQGISSPNDTLVGACGPDPANAAHCWEWTAQLPDDVKKNTFLPVGTITEMPIHLSGLVRFRPESPLDPYIGLGVGYIVTNLKKGDEFNRTAAFISDPTFRVTVADEGEYNINNRCRRENGGNCTDFNPGPLEANVKNSFEWHAVGGVDYYMTDHTSVYVDARYVWTSGSIDIRTDDAHQVRFAVLDQGRLILQQQGSINQPFLWEDIGVPENADFHTKCPQCQGDGMLETEDKNMTGALDPTCDPNTGVFCEDEGFLYQLPPGSRSFTKDEMGEAIRIPCDKCAHNGLLDTEDANGNGYLDRFLVYGIDICTTTAAGTNPRCGCGPPPLPACPLTNNNVNYIWPEGCPQRPDQLGPFAQLKESGCPAFPRNSDGSFASFGSTARDNAADTFIIQGGRIRMGGFALGFGFKFSF